MSKSEDLSKMIMEALKNKDTVRLNVLRLVKGAVQLEHINNKRELDDDLFTEVVVKQIKERNESIEEFKKGNRQDLVDKTMEEIKVLEEYLPPQLSDEEVDKIISVMNTAMGITQIYTGLCGMILSLIVLEIVEK